jgi:hypothetical protein
MGSSSARNCDARNRVPIEFAGAGQPLAEEEGTRSGAKTGLTGRGPLAELDHLAQADASGREAGIMPDGVHQSLRLLPGHDGLLHGDLGRETGGCSDAPCASTQEDGEGALCRQAKDNRETAGKLLRVVSHNWCFQSWVESTPRVRCVVGGLYRGSGMTQDMGSELEARHEGGGDGSREGKLQVSRRHCRM